MDKAYAKYMRLGKKIKTAAGEEFKLLVDMDESKDTVLAVPMEHLRRYELLQTWSRNHVGVTDEQKMEMKGYEVELPIDAVEPANKVRFITPDYMTLFMVPDLSYVRVNGEPRQVVYLDETHFHFAKSGCFHICEFAELCERNGNRVEVI